MRWTLLSGVALLFVLSGCAGSEPEVGSGPNSTEATTTSTEAPSPVTSSIATTSVPTSEPVAVIEYEDVLGWAYVATVYAEEPSPDASDLGCVPTAPPGFVNIRFSIEIEALVEDRPSPYPWLNAGSNVADTGRTISAKPFERRSVLRARTELDPNPSARVCSDAARLGGAGEIDPGSPALFLLTVGPVIGDQVERARFALKFFTNLIPGERIFDLDDVEWVELRFTQEPSSGLVHTGHGM